jgi:hypothetical protein
MEQAMMNLSLALILLGLIALLRLPRKHSTARQSKRAALASCRADGPGVGLASGQHAQAVTGQGTTGKRTAMSEPRMILQQITSFLEGRQIGYRLSADETAIEVWFTCETARFLVTISVHPAGVLCVVTHMPQVVPEQRRTAVAELIARINYGLVVGGFALSLSDGNLHFRVTLPLADAELTQEQFDRLIGASLWTVQRYHKAVCRLLYGDDLSPAEAVAEVEMAG